MASSYAESERRRAARSGLDRVAAVDRNRRAGDKVGRRRGEKDRDAAEVVDRAPAPGRGALEHAVVQAWYLRARLHCQLGVDPARQDGVDLDVVGGPGRGAGLGELHDASL